jgi:hypothetical protein
MMDSVAAISPSNVPREARNLRVPGVFKQTMERLPVRREGTDKEADSGQAEGWRNGQRRESI